MPGNSVSVLLRRLGTLVARPKAAEQSDQHLLGLFVAQREEAAFAALLERHGPMVLGVCRRILQDEHLAEDVFQATFLVLARNAARIRKRQSLGSWLHGVALRLARKARMAATRAQQAAVRSPSQRALDPQAEASWREAQAILDEELRRLPDNYRLPLVLCYLEGYTRDEAAVQLGWSTGKLKGLLERGRDQLRARLTRRGVTLAAAGAAALLTDTALSATVSPLLAIATVGAAVRFAAGQTLAACGIAAPVAALTKGELKIMASHKLTLIVVLALLATVLGSGVGMLAQQAPLPPGANEPGIVQPQSAVTREPGLQKELAAAPWGVEVDGLQCRLRADKLVWQVGEVPTFQVDVRNRGLRRDLKVTPDAPAHQVQVDKFLADWRGDDATGREPRALLPGKQLDGIPFRLGNQWVLGASFGDPPPARKIRSIDPNAKLKFTPGRHVVRVAVYADGKDKTWARVLSNAVVIEVVQPGKKPAPATVQTSPPAILKGLSLVIHLDKQVFAAEDMIDLGFTLRNESGKAISIGDGYLGPDYQEVGPARHFEVHATPTGQNPLLFWSGMMTEGQTSGLRKILRLAPGEAYTGTIRLSAGATRDKKYAYHRHEERGGHFAAKGAKRAHVLGHDAHKYSVVLVYQVDPETHGVFEPPQGFNDKLLWQGKLTSQPLSLVIAD